MLASWHVCGYLSLSVALKHEARFQTDFVPVLVESQAGRVQGTDG